MIKTDFIIKTEDLHKRFKNVKAVQGVNLNMKKGDVYGFLGPNGAGKTTTIKMILGLTYPDSGNVFINGKNVAEYGVDLRVADINGFSIVIPDFISMANLLAIFTFWIVVPLGVGYYFYRKRDI